MRAIPESWLKIGYNLLFTVGFALTWPYLTYLIWRRQPFWERLGERLGHYPQELKEWLKHHQRPVWIHAVSVGEMLLARVLVREIYQEELKVLAFQDGLILWIALFFLNFLLEYIDLTVLDL